MPSKKKKYNARFPPARIKKIMQTDEDVGKVAAAVPVIISRALELFIESLIVQASQATRAKNAKTLSTSHIKQIILAEKKFDFLKDLVASIPDIQQAEEDTETGSSNPESSTPRPRGRPRKKKTEGAAPPKKRRKRRVSSEDDSATEDADSDTEECHEDDDEDHENEDEYDDDYDEEYDEDEEDVSHRSGHNSANTLSAPSSMNKYPDGASSANLPNIYNHPTATLPPFHSGSACQPSLPHSPLDATMPYSYSASSTDRIASYSNNKPAVPMPSGSYDCPQWMPAPPAATAAVSSFQGVLPQPQHMDHTDDDYDS